MAGCVQWITRARASLLSDNQLYLSAANWHHIPMQLKNLIDQPGKLPMIPKVAHELMASFASEDVSVHQIAQQLAADPGLSAKLLRLANSAYFHFSGTVGTVEAAVQMLGFVMVRNLVLGNSLAAAYQKVHGLDLPQFWRYCLYSACAARWLAQRSGGDADLVFTVGLMHGIGQLQLHAVAPEATAALTLQLPVLAAERAQLEQQSLGFHHLEVSAELASLWNFPQDLVQALRSVAQPLSAAEFSAAGALVHLGAWCARGEVLGLTAEEQLASYPAAVARSLSLGSHWLPAAISGSLPGEGDVMPALTELSAGLEAMFE